MADVHVVVVAAHVGALRNTRHFLEVARRLATPKTACASCSIGPTATDLAINDVAAVVGTRRIFQLPERQAHNPPRP